MSHSRSLKLEGVGNRSIQSKKNAKIERPVSRGRRQLRQVIVIVHDGSLAFKAPGPERLWA